MTNKLLVRNRTHKRTRGLGGIALWWMHTFLVHGPGDVQDVPLSQLPLDDEFRGFVADCYALNDEGRRLYGSAFISRAKGRAKSELAGFIALFEAFGPARFDGWAKGGETFTVNGHTYTYSPGEAMGRTIVYPFIRCLATEESQAGNTYDVIYSNLGGYGTGSAELIEAYAIRQNDVGLTRIILSGGGEIVPSTASSSSKDGGKESFVVFDESHLYVSPELHRMYNVVTRNLTKRSAAEPWGLETSTMYAPGEGSIAESSHQTALMILEGKLRRENLLFDHRQADLSTDLADEESLTAGLREAYGPASEWMDLDRLIAQIYDPRASVADSRRYFLNQPTAASDAWLTAPEWEACRQEIELMPGDAITLGFDGSQKRTKGIADATALVACRLSDGAVVTLRVWEQPTGPAGDDWRVDVNDVIAAVAEAFNTYMVVGFYADPAKWEGVVAEWEREYGPQLKVKSTAKNPIEWWMVSGRSVTVTRAIERFENAVRDGDLIHDGNTTLQQHALNARRRPTAQGMKIAKEHPQSARKIDAVVAAILAFECRADALAQGVTAKKKRSRVLVAY